MSQIFPKGYVFGLNPNEENGIRMTDLADVNMNGIKDGQVLKYNILSRGFEPANMEEGGSGTTDYEQLDNKPSINGVELTGNKTSAQLNMYTKDDVNDLLEGYITSAQLIERLAAKADLIQSVTYDGNQLKYYDPITQRYQNVPISGGEGSIYQVETKVDIDDSWMDTALEAFITTLLANEGLLSIQLSAGTLATKYGTYANLIGYVYGNSTHNIVYLTGTTSKGYPCSLNLHLSSLANFKSNLKLNVITDEVTIADNQFSMDNGHTHFMNVSAVATGTVRYNETTQQLEYYNDISAEWNSVPNLKTFVFEVPDSDFTTVGLPSAYALNTNGFVISFSLTKDSIHYVGEAGSAKNVYGSQDKLFSYCHRLNNTNYLVVISSADLTGFTPTILSLNKYPHMSSQGTLTSALAIPFDTTKENHLVDINVTLQRRYPNGTTSGTQTATLRYLFITTPLASVIPIVINTNYNLKLGNTSYAPGTFTITNIPSDNSYDITQDSVLEAVSATATVIEEW